MVLYSVFIASQEKAMIVSVLPVAIIGAAVAYEYYKRQIVSTKETTIVEGGFDEDE